MKELESAAHRFLHSDGIAVAGYSRDPASPARLIARRLRDSGCRVVALNPRATEIDGEPCYPDLRSLPEKVEAVMAVTPPEATEELVRDAAACGVRRIWMHRSFGRGSVSPHAVELCHGHGIEVIPGACPMMFCGPVDFGHRCIRWLLRVTGGLPRPEGTRGTRHETSSREGLRADG